MTKCKKIISLILAVVMLCSIVAVSAISATGDVDNKIYAFKFNEDDYRPGMATNPADSYYTENDGTLVVESNELHQQYQMNFEVNTKNASRLEEAIITACRYYDGVIATEVHIPWAKNKWGTNCSPEIGITFLNSAKKTVCKADLAKYQPDTLAPHQVLVDVTCFINPDTGEVSYNNEIKYVYVQIQCYDWGCGSGSSDGGTRGKYTISPFYVLTGREEVNTIPTEKPDPNQQTLLKFSKSNKNDYDNAPSSRKYSADGVNWKSEGMATDANAGYLEMKQINIFNQMQVNYGFQHNDALKNAVNLAKSEQGTGYAKFTVNIVNCLDYTTRKDMIAEIKFAVASAKDSGIPYQEYTAWQYPGTTRTYYIDMTRYNSYQDLTSFSVAIQNYWHVKTNADGTKEIFDYDREINWDSTLDKSEELGYVRTYLFNTTVIVSPIVVIPKTAEATHTFKNTESKAVLNKFNTDSCVVPATEEEKASIDPNAKGYKGEVIPTTTPSTSGNSGSTSTVKKPSIPKISSVSATSSKITVKWGKTSNAKYYTVQRKTGSGSYKTIKSNTTATSLTDKVSKAGKYTYRVVAIASDKKTKSSYSSAKSAVILAAPKISSAKVVNKNQIKIKYGKVSSAKKYQIYRKVNSGAWKKIKTLTSTSYTDKTAKTAGTYYYKVRAVDSKGVAFAYSSTKKITGVMSFSAKATIKTSALKKGLKVTLSKKVKNASGYQIQYSKKSTMKSAKTTTVKSSAKTKSVTKLSAKTKYYVRVRAYKTISGKKVYGAWSSKKTVTTKK